MSKQKRFLACFLALAIAFGVGALPVEGSAGATLTPAEAGALSAVSLAEGGESASLAPSSGATWQNEGAGSASLSPTAGNALSPDAGTSEESSVSLWPESGASAQGSETFAPETREGSARESKSVGEEPTPDAGENDEDSEENEEGSSALARGIMPLAMTPWGGDGIIVETYTEFRNTLINNNGYNKIYLGADINANAAGEPALGVSIHGSKRNVVISGIDPRTGVRHSLQTRNNDGGTMAIHVTAANAAVGSVTFEDIDLTIMNYWGAFYTPEVVAFRKANFQVTFRNVKAEGKQLFWGPTSRLILEDVEFTSTNIGFGSFQEVAELRSMDMYGTVTITHSTTAARPAFWFWGGSASTDRYFRVHSNATVNINSNYDIIRNETSGSSPLSIIVDDGATVNISATGTMPFLRLVAHSANTQCDVTVGNGGQLNIKAPRFHYAIGEFIRNLNVEPGGAFRLERTATGSHYGVRISNNLSVGAGASFVLQNVGTYPAIYLGTSSANAEFDDPAYLQISSPNSPVMSFSPNGRPVDMVADTVNIWHGEPLNMSDDIANMPTAIWNKEQTAVPARFNLSYDATGAPSAISTNISSVSDPVPAAEMPNATNLNMDTARQLIMGRFVLTGEVKTSGVTGLTQPGAYIAMQCGAPSSSHYGLAEPSGAYKITPGGSALILSGESVTIVSHSNMLKARLIKAAEHDPDRGLRFEIVPSILDFGTVTVQLADQIVPRTDPNWYIQVYDGRGAGRAWKVGASIASPLTSGGGDTLPGALVYMDGGLTTTLGSAETLIYSGTTVGAPMTPGAYTDINWAATEGPLLHIGAGQGMIGETYNSTISWTLYDTP